MRQMPRESRQSGKLPTYDNGEKGRSDMTDARRQIAIPVLLSCAYSKGALVSHKLFPSILLACALFAFPALAQTGAAPKAAASATNKADVLTPDQAKRALDTLQDDKKRAQMIDTLRAIANASPQAQAAPPAPGPQPAIPLTADSLGAQLLLTVSEQVGETLHEITDMARTLTNFPAFYFWIVRTANDPTAYNQLLDIAATWLVTLAVVNAYALSRGLICAVRALAGPFGLLRVRADTAAYIEIWARRIVAVGVSGIAFANVALLLGLYRAGYAAVLHLVMLIVHLFIVVIILQCRRQVAQAIRAPAGREGMAARVRDRVAGLWHYLAIALDLALWAVWALNIRNGYSLLLQYFVGTMAVALITRLATIVVLSLIDRGFSISPDILQRFPALETRPNRYLPLLREIVSTVIPFIGFVALLEVWGVDAIVWFYGGQIGSRLLSAAATIGVAALAAAAIWEASKALMDRQLHVLSSDGHFARAARLRTL